MATAPAKPPLRPAAPVGNGTGAHAKPAMASSGTFTAEQLSPDSTAFPPLYEAALLYAADCYDAAELVLKENLRSKEGKDSLRVWLMLFDLYHLTNNRKEFDALSMLFTVKFERSPPVWTSASETADPRRKEKRERKDFFPMSPTPESGLLPEIDKFEAFAKEMGSCRVGFEKVKVIHNEEAELLSLVFARLRRMKIPMWFNGFADFTALLKKSINDLSGQPVSSSQGYWSLLFELYILDGKHEEYDELGLEYAVAFEMSPPAWEDVVRPGGPADEKGAAPGADSQAPAEAGVALKGVFSANSKDMLQQLAIFAASRPQEVMVDLSGLMRIDFSATSQFFEAVRSIHLAQKRVILSNLNELVAAQLEVFGMTKHAILMRKKAA
ncbi:MAG: STAS domain-containing protein [Betaproteobacteria bacterium]|nr:STAS domain-containing protein [Betaproteobacteria bacterium]